MNNNVAGLMKDGRKVPKLHFSWGCLQSKLQM